VDDGGYGFILKIPFPLIVLIAAIFGALGGKW
jgi:hypothetical protein